MKLWIDPLNKADNLVLVNHFFCPPFPQARLSPPKMTWMPDINIASGRGGGRKYVIFMGLLPLCPKSSSQDCSLDHFLINQWKPTAQQDGILLTCI